ncbi:gp53-like domain-containing protein [Microvirgula aerodenitrificans]|uniref:gp53-like domain-containing protein n=1 Tax=Microvirgula aerodenitrificans TaxID=57480 RepID=UPI00248D8B39|nr:hypothetical protein [Microvirgula aerodenitrificans]
MASQAASVATGDGAGTFRLPDYNGKSAGSLGAVFMRGDGALSAGADGVIQGDELKSHKHETVDTSNFLLTNFPAFGKSGITRTGAAYATTFNGETTLTAAVGGAETRPLNVTGCWVIRLFGAVVNPGAADAAQLATEVSKLGADKVPYAAFQGANQALATSGYQRLPGGLILQWGTYTYSAGTDSVTFSVTFPLAFPASCFLVAGNASGTSDFFSDVSKMTTGFSGRIFDRIGSAPVGPGSLYWYAIGN